MSKYLPVNHKVQKVETMEQSTMTLLVQNVKNEAHILVNNTISVDFWTLVVFKRQSA